MTRALVTAAALALLLPTAANAAGRGHVGRADRRAINATLDAFVPTAVERRNVMVSYDLVTPALRGGMTRAQWASGDIPVYPFPARGRSFHYWTLDYAIRNEVAVDLFLQPRARAKVGPIAFSIDLKRVRGRWLVDSIYPTAIFPRAGSGGGVRAASDYAAPASRNTPPGSSRLGHVWVLVPASFLGLGIAVPIVLFVGAWWRDRRAYNAYRR